ncbi:hypothetical protein B5F07_04950 [Lachnoclostridium sp. An169]|uniref:L,D-transpeptidase family protein n=1 Tax=Lachnoclostridium sp. An169 TaxID=1965569 RepID=UPI000B39840E|nr:L,D-transpeptidase family protein [Lachnoclostridium sp. An169]OUP85531.1 hypothetical protein B5F07_04950 [Lachnoclostridium sp. An169]HJA65788.1 L,D-transpeptidase/peptidoglycan binding protein [Candidatus Mediterraneibacter cottocaccae]
MNSEKKNSSDALTPEEEMLNAQTEPELTGEGTEDSVSADKADRTDENTGEEETHPEADAEGRAADEGTPGEESAGKDRKRRRGRRRGRGRRNRAKKDWGKKPFIIAGGIVGGLLVIYLGISAFFISHFYFNTMINGQDFSGKTVSDVEDYLKQQVSGYSLTVREQNNETDVISGADISLTYVENDDIRNALDSQNPLLWPSALFSQSSTDVTVEVGYDEAALTEKIQSLKAVTKEQTQPTSAYPKYDGNSFVIQPETYGTAVDLEVLTEKVKQYITEFKTELRLMDESCYIMPTYTKNSAEVQEACDTMNRYCQASITYTMDKDVVVDKTLISTWLTCSDDMQVSVDYDSVRAWMREFGKTYDTVGTTRTITTPTGKTAQVSGGTYGWSVNEDQETQDLINSIQNAEVVEREPAYKQTAASRGAQDWGNTYLEVDMSAQHMWYIVNGSVVLETDVVTGRPTPDRETPQGVYSVVEKMRNKVLRGSIDPATGKPEYETPVSYWMRITWTGIGFHDATWQAKFGGDWYQNHGSHGCINMPLDKAAQLYDMLEMHTPAIVHY